MESMGAVGDWVRARGHAASGTHLYRSADFPDPGDLDLLVVLGGPMNIYEHDAYRWLAPEKAFIRSVIDAGKPALGICLGAQLIADVLGGPVTKNGYREVGWYPVTLTPLAASAAASGPASVFAGFPAQFTTFHAHGDTFAIPPGAVHVASSAACVNQAFACGDGRVVGLQFHLEWTRHIMKDYVAKSLPNPADTAAEPWIQNAADLQAADAPYETSHALLFTLLDRMARSVG
jgi:GMP synthase-like glutamine amidotransferase